MAIYSLSAQTSIGMRKLYEVTDIAEIVAWLHELIAGVKVAKVGASGEEKKGEREAAPPSPPNSEQPDDDHGSDSEGDSDGEFLSDYESDDEDSLGTPGLAPFRCEDDK